MARDISEWVNRGVASGGCLVCGRQPTTELHLRQNTGLLVARRWHTLDARYCRDHGLPLARQWLARTLALGWWGLISFFANFYAIAADVQALVKLSRLAPAKGLPMSGTVAAKQAEQPVIEELARRFRQAAGDEAQMQAAWHELSPRLDPETREQLRPSFIPPES